MAVTTPYAPVVVQVTTSGSVLIPFGFPSGSRDYLIVKANDDIVDPAMYTVAPSDLMGGGTVTILDAFNDSLPKPITYTIERFTPRIQPDVYSDQTQISSVTLEGSLNNLAMQIQEVSEDIDNFPDTEQLELDVAQAKATANTALTTANNANTTANNASTMAETAKDRADVAWGIANSANLNAVAATQIANQHANRHHIGGGDPLDLSLLGAVSTTDPRLADSRVPTLHASTHAVGGSDPITPSSIGAVYTTDSRLSDSRDPLAHAATHADGGVDALAKASSTIFGVVKPDGTTITASNGVLTAVGGGGGGGTSVHNELSGRDAANQHPTSAIYHDGGTRNGDNVDKILDDLLDLKPESPYFSYDGTNKAVKLRDIVAAGSIGPGSGGTTDHNLLTNRNMADQHSQSSITNLVADLGAITGRIVNTETGIQTNTNSIATLNTSSSALTTRVTTNETNIQTANTTLQTQGNTLTTLSGVVNLQGEKIVLIDATATELRELIATNTTNIAGKQAQITASTTDLTAGSSVLATGSLYVVYE